MTIFVSIAVSLAVGVVGGLILEYRYAPLAWVVSKYRKVVG